MPLHGWIGLGVVIIGYFCYFFFGLKAEFGDFWKQSRKYKKLQKRLDLLKK